MKKRRIIAALVSLSLVCQGTGVSAAVSDTGVKSDTAPQVIELTYLIAEAGENTSDDQEQKYETGSGIWDGEELDINDPTGLWKPYKFIIELNNEFDKFIRENDEIDHRTSGIHYDLEEPENSKLEVIVGDERSKELAEEFAVSLGYDRDILDITVNPDFLPVPDIAIVLFGDTNSDGTVDVSDLTRLSLSILGDASLNGLQTEMADVNRDNEINIQDIALLKQYIMHDDVRLGVIS